MLDVNLYVAHSSCNLSKTQTENEKHRKKIGYFDNLLCTTDDIFLLIQSTAMEQTALIVFRGIGEIFNE